MEPGEIPVRSAKITTVHHQSIVPAKQEDVAPIVDALRTIAREGQVSGTVTLNLSRGGVRSIDVKNVEERSVSGENSKKLVDTVDEQG